MDKIKKVIMVSLLEFTMLVFMVSSAMAAEPEDVIGNANVSYSTEHYALNMTGKSDRGKKATATTELQTVDPFTSIFGFGGDNANREQLRMILLLMCMPESWQTIPMNIQLR